MKVITLLLSVCAVALAYDDITDLDVDALVSDPVETKKYLDCYLDKGPCTPVMSKIKGHIQEAFSNSCEKCTVKEKHKVEEFILNVLVKYPDVLGEIKQKYDPEGKNFSKFAFEVSKY